jgi:hypothetical protein
MGKVRVTCAFMWEGGGVNPDALVLLIIFLLSVKFSFLDFESVDRMVRSVATSSIPRYDTKLNNLSHFLPLRD